MVKSMYNYNEYKVLLFNMFLFLFRNQYFWQFYPQYELYGPSKTNYSQSTHPKFDTT